jgi:AcrR family transcriptional regulator
MAHAELARELTHEARPYHHGDLSRALILAGRRILEKEGPAALSLRAVAREAGVSPAAPYHHFKDKGDLLAAVASEGWQELGEAIVKARGEAPDPRHGLNEIGFAYVTFARANPNLYRLMYDTACDQEDMPDHAKDESSGWGQVRASLLAVGMDPGNELELKLATIAAWCAAHGVAEMVGFKEFGPLKQALGGEAALVRAILDHLGIYARHVRHEPSA